MVDDRRGFTVGDIASFAAIDEANWAVVNVDALWLTADAGKTWQERDKVLDPRCSFALVRFVDQATGLASEFCQATAGVIEGCERGAEYKSDWDCPPIGTPLLTSRDGGRTWAAANKPILR